MAFYNRKMAENKSLTKAWRAGHLRKLDGDEEIRLPEICGEIARWMRRDRRPRSRLSLRSFSVLLSGAIRIYGNQVDHLMKDTFSCSLFTPITPRHLPIEQNMFRETVETYTTSNDSHSESTEPNPDEEDPSPADDDEHMSDDESTVFTATPNNDQQTINERGNQNKRDQQIQTSPTPEPDNFGGFDPNLPFGYVIIHDNYFSRIPSKILFSSLSENVKYVNVRKPMN